MIRIEVKRKNGSIVAMISSGHSGYAENGKDIICSAVSALTYTAVGAINELVGQCPYKDLDGHLSFALPDSFNEEQIKKAAFILEVVLIGLKQIRLSYKKYVRIVYEEV